MDKRQNTYLQMMAAVRQTVEAFATVWSGSPSFAGPYGLLISNVLQEIAAAAGTQQLKTTGVSQTKREARATLEAQVLSIAAIIVAYATATGNTVLRQDAHLTRYHTGNARADALIGMKDRIAALALAHLAALAPFGITTARIAALDADAAAFIALIGQPRALRDARKEGTARLAALVALGRSYLEVMDAQMILFREASPDFYHQYFSVRKLVMPARRKRAIYITAADEAGQPLAGVMVKIASLRVAKRLPASGRGYLQHAAPGEYTATASKPGYADKVMAIAVNTSETTQLHFVMEALH